MYIMDTRDELANCKKELKKLSTRYSDLQTEFVMMEKYFQDNSQLKYSKQRFELVNNECTLLKNELELMKQSNTSLREEISSLTKSCIQSNEIITTVLTEIQHGSKSSMLSLHNLVSALEQKISILLSKSDFDEKKKSQSKSNGANYSSIFKSNENSRVYERSNNVLQDTQQFLQNAMNTLK